MNQRRILAKIRTCGGPPPSASLHVWHTFVHIWSKPSGNSSFGRAVMNNRKAGSIPSFNFPNKSCKEMACVAEGRHGNYYICVCTPDTTLYRSKYRLGSALI